MKNIMNSLVSAVFILAILTSCGSDQSSTKTVDASSEITEIEDLMQQMFAYSSAPDMRLKSDSVADQLKSRYDQFVKEYPEHEMAPVYLDQAANVERKKKDYTSALGYYDRIINEYPNYESIIQVKFLKGFVYDAELNDKDKAREFYQIVADEYPENVFGKDAKARLMNLHMSDQELIEYFEKNNDIKD